MKYALGGVMVAGLLITTAAQASEEWQFSLGAGVATERSPYVGVGTETDLFPLLSIEKGRFSFEGNAAGYEVLSSKLASLTVLGHYRGEGYDASDSRQLAGMEERDGAFELGARAEMYTDLGTLSVTALGDVSSTHDGYEVSLGWETSYQLNSQWVLSPSAQLSYRSKDLNNYYFGVRNSEATSERAAYIADSGAVLNLGVDAMYLIDEQQSLMLGAGVDTFSDEIKDSSIVERSNSPYAVLAYIYRF